MDHTIKIYMMNDEEWVAAGTPAEASDYFLRVTDRTPDTQSGEPVECDDWEMENLLATNRHGETLSFRHLLDQLIRDGFLFPRLFVRR